MSTISRAADRMTRQILTAVDRLPTARERAEAMQTVMAGVGRMAGNPGLSQQTARLTLALEASGAPARTALAQAVKEALTRQIVELAQGGGLGTDAKQINTTINAVGGAVSALTSAIGEGVVGYLQVKQQGRELQRQVTEHIAEQYREAAPITFTPGVSMPWGTLVVGGVAVAGLIGITYMMKKRGEEPTYDPRA